MASCKDGVSGSTQSSDNSETHHKHPVPKAPLAATEDVNSPNRSCVSYSSTDHILPPSLDQVKHALDVNIASGNNQPVNCLSDTVLTVLSSDSMVCRICFEGESKEHLYAPCKCTGTMALIHQTCIEQWLGAKNSSKCEICSFKFVTHRQPRPWWQWFTNPDKQIDTRNLVGDGICFIVLTPLASVSVWLCLSGALKYRDFENAFWESVGLISLSVFLIFIYLLWCFVAGRYHVRVFREWQESHSIVRIQGLRRDSDTTPPTTDPEDTLQLSEISAITYESYNDIDDDIPECVLLDNSCDEPTHCQGGETDCIHSRCELIPKSCSPLNSSRLDEESAV